MAEVEKIRKKRKKWSQVLAPEGIHDGSLGESLIEDPAKLVGRQLTLNLFTIHNDFRRQHINLTFSIKGVADNKLQTDVVAYSLSPSYVKRIVRRGRNRIDDSFALKTKDGVMIRIKPTMITQFRAKSSIRTDLVKGMRAAIKDKVSETSFVEIVKQLLDAKFQKELKSKLVKMYPIKQIEVRFFGADDAKKETVDLKLVKQTVREPEENYEEEEDLKEKIARKQKEAEAEGEVEAKPEAVSEDESSEKTKKEDVSTVKSEEKAPDNKKDE